MSIFNAACFCDRWCSGEGTGQYVWVSCLWYVPVSFLVFFSPGCLGKTMHCSFPPSFWTLYFGGCCFQ
jgi:hypothetical protein